MQKRYEAIRSYYVDNLKPKQIAEKFNYSIHTVYKLLAQLPNMDLKDIFNKLQRGPKTYHKRTLKIKDKIIALRKKNYSIPEISERLKKENQQVSYDTIQRILNNEGFSRLFRRTKAELYEIRQAEKIYPEKTDIKIFQKMRGKYITAYAGIFLFLPIIEELELYKIFSTTKFYGTKSIPKENYLLSYLTLKLLGRERISHVTDLSFDEGLGIFVGLNSLPKTTALTQYSYRHPSGYTIDLLKKFGKKLYDKKLVKGNYLNVDFHPIPYYGRDETLDNNWIPLRNKNMKSILSFFVQDMETNYLIFSDGEIDREERSYEIIRFIEHFKSITGQYPRHLVFDSKVTTYEKLNILNELGIKFITLRRRGQKIRERISRIKDWKTINLNIPKRIYNNLKVRSEIIKVNNYDGKLREIVVTGTGRNLPMVVITNDFESREKEIVTIYSKRWRIENNIQENVDFFNLNAINSPVIVNVNFDIGMTLIANSLYKYLASKIKPLSKCKPKKVYRSLIETKGTITVEEKNIKVKFGPKSFNPYIMNLLEKKSDFLLPWFSNKSVSFDF